jgi:formate dehydrogenase beta subunit
MDGQATAPARRHARATPKGRQVDPDALDMVVRLIGDGPHPRDRMLDHLHTLNDAHGCLRHAHLVALAHAMRLSMVEVFEVASFYAHFDILPDDAPPPPPVTIRVCDGIACMLAGGEALRADLAARHGAGTRVVAAPCMGGCDRAPVAMTVKRTGGRTAPAVGFDAYRAAGGYRLLRDGLDGRVRIETVIAALKGSGLRGMGGAGFPTGTKWDLVRQQPGPRLMAVNADEGEPGTFKDRWFLETDPHRFIEGMLIGAWVVGADTVHVYLRDEYPDARAILTRAFEEVRAADLAPHVTIRLHRGAGAYICGEETAMLESIAGRRPLPRNKPPYPSEVGLFGRPTLINNVETLWWVRDIVERGADWWAGQGRRGRQGLRAFSLSGRVRSPGVKLAPAGISVRELIDEHGGGMAEGHAFRAYLPGGASGGILPAALGDLPLDFATLEPHGSFIGSAAVVVLSDQDDLKAVARNLVRFFADESCGQCTPCRVGTEKAEHLLAADRWDRARLDDLTAVMTDASICGLGQAAMNPVRSLWRHFPEDVP